MTDKNGKELKTGCMVKIEGGYFKADNGTFLIKHSPGDENWLGSEYCLKKCNKIGEESTTKYATAFWPLMSTTNSREKRMAAKAHNETNAQIEIVGNVEVHKVVVRQNVYGHIRENIEVVTPKRFAEIMAYNDCQVEILAY